MKKQTVTLDRTFDAPVEKVWQALTDISKMREWYFPMLEDFKPEVGFTTEFNVVKDGKDYLHIWKVVEVIPNKKISYEWRYGGFPGNSLLTFELTSIDGKTRLVLTHDHLESFEGDIHPALAPSNFLQGWTYFMNIGLPEWIGKQ